MSITPTRFYATAVTDSYHFTIPVDGRSLGAGTWNGNQYTMFDWAPYGTRFRLKRSFNVDGYCSGGLDTACPYEKAILNTLKVYGMVLLDGTTPADDWDTGILSNGFYPDQLVDAATALHNWHPIEHPSKWSIRPTPSHSGRRWPTSSPATRKEPRIRIA